MSPDRKKAHPTIPPEAWLPAIRLAAAVRGPVDRFLRIEAASGILLILAAAAALVWANSPFADSYESVFHTPIFIGIGSWMMEESLHFWINDLLMTIFFLLVGLEIKREIVEGALSDLKRATLPMTAAIGGMLVPAAIFIAINPFGAAREGWGVPMATDIAFAVGVLTLLGSRVPAALRILLLTVAIIDDVGAILIIAIFYSTGFDLNGLLLAGVGVLVLWTLLKMGFRPGMLYAVPLLIMWAGMLRSGIHPTIAGVIAGLSAPVGSWFGKEGFVKVAREALDDFQERVNRPHDDHELAEPLSRLSQAGREALSPALRTEIALHPWVAYFIMPLFALANAGVHLSGIDVARPEFSTITAGVVLGLAIGKPLGIMAFSWVSVRLGLCVLPKGVRWRDMMVVGIVAGIGFTMSIFIGELAFEEEALLAIAKVGVLAATVIAAVGGLAFGNSVLRRDRPAAAPQLSASDIEASSEYWSGTRPLPESLDQGSG